jgi:hypothetical protein
VLPVIRRGNGRLSGCRSGVDISGALMPSLDCREACTHRKQIANLFNRQRDRQIRTEAGRPGCPVGEFQLTEAPSTTPHCCRLAESLRLLVWCIPTPSRYFGRPLSPVARAQSEPPGSGGNAWGFCFGKRGASIRPAPRWPGGSLPTPRYILPSCAGVPPTS